MPFVLAGLGAVAIGFFAFVTAAGIVWALNGIANVLEENNPFSVLAPIGQWVSGLASSIEGALVSAGGALWGDVSEWVWGHAWIVQSMAQELANLSISVTGVLERIARYQVPEALQSAESYAVSTGLLFKHQVEEGIESAVGEAEQLVVPAEWAPYQNPSTGGRGPRGNILAVVAAGVAAAVTYAAEQGETAKEYARQQTGQAEGRATQALVEAKAQIGGSIAAAASQAHQEVRDAEVNALNEILAAEGRAEGHLADARAALERGTTAAEGRATQQIGEAQTALQQSIDNKAATAKLELEADKTTLEGRIASAEGTAKAALERERATLDSRITTAEDTAARELGEAKTKLQTAVNASEGRAREELQKAEDSLTESINVVSTSFTAKLTQLFTGFTEDLTGLAAAVAGDLSGLPALILATVAAPLAALAARVTHLEECAVTTCEGPNNLERLLETGESVAAVAALYALLAEWINDPSSVDSAFADTVSGVYTAQKSILEAILDL